MSHIAPAKLIELPYAALQDPHEAKYQETWLPVRTRAALTDLITVCTTLWLPDTQQIRLILSSDDSPSDIISHGIRVGTTTGVELLSPLISVSRMAHRSLEPLIPLANIILSSEPPRFFRRWHDDEWESDSITVTCFRPNDGEREAANDRLMRAFSSDHSQALRIATAAQTSEQAA